MCTVSLLSWLACIPWQKRLLKFPWRKEATGHAIDLMGVLLAAVKHHIKPRPPRRLSSFLTLREHRLHSINDFYTTAIIPPLPTWLKLFRSEQCFRESRSATVATISNDEFFFSHFTAIIIELS